MTRVGIASDLHLEFYPPAAWRAWIEAFPVAGMDVLVLAGDIAVKPLLQATLEAFIAKGVPIVYVLGNHEHYGVGPDVLAERMRALEAAHPGLFHWLDAGRDAHVAGLHFAGCTGWPLRHPQPPGEGMDLYRMPGVQQWLPRFAEKHDAWLRHRAPVADVIVTHMQPTIRAVASPYIGSPDNWYFCLELDDLIRAAQPPLWIGGHTHQAWDGRVGNTRVVINPRGYPSELHAQRNFRPGLTVDVEPRRRTG